MTPLPTIEDDQALDAFMHDHARVRSALDHVAERLGITEPFEVPLRGSALIGIGQREVVKVMAPHDTQHHEVELACLQALNGQLPVTTPRILDAGELDGWHYIRMSRLEGQELAELWPTLNATQRLSLATQLGEVLAQLHAIEAPAVVPRLNWTAWCAKRLDSLEATQRARDCPPALLDGLEACVRGADLSEGETGWLHTEVMLEHLLCSPTTDGWRLSGLFDFEPSWVAPIHYEFASIGLFVSAGDASILSEVLRAYGTTVEPSRLFAMAMMHRYANLGWYHRRLGGPEHVQGLPEAWFGQN